MSAGNWGQELFKKWEGLEYRDGIVIRVKVADAQARSVIASLNSEVKNVDDDISKKMNQIRYVWSYFNHLVTLGLTSAKRMAKTQEQQIGIQYTQLGIQILQTQFAVSHMVQMGIGYIASGNPVLAATMFTLASSMELSQVQMAQLQIDTIRNQQAAQSIKEQIEAYSQ